MKSRRVVELASRLGGLLGLLLALAYVSEALPVGQNSPQITLNDIAFGSCNNQDKVNRMWPHIRASKPDLWIWLGDNVYSYPSPCRFPSSCNLIAL